MKGALVFEVSVVTDIVVSRSVVVSVVVIVRHVVRGIRELWCSVLLEFLGVSREIPGCNITEISCHTCPCRQSCRQRLNPTEDVLNDVNHCGCWYLFWTDFGAWNAFWGGVRCHKNGDMRRFGSKVARACSPKGESHFSVQVPSKQPICSFVVSA